MYDAFLLFFYNAAVLMGFSAMGEMRRKTERHEAEKRKWMEIEENKFSHFQRMASNGNIFFPGIVGVIMANERRTKTLRCSRTVFHLKFSLSASHHPLPSLTKWNKMRRVALRNEVKARWLGVREVHSLRFHSFNLITTNYDSFPNPPKRRRWTTTTMNGMSWT